MSAPRCRMPKLGEMLVAFRGPQEWASIGLNNDNLAEVVFTRGGQVGILEPVPLESAWETLLAKDPGGQWEETTHAVMGMESAPLPFSVWKEDQQP